jgi:hypothetical protein
MKLYSWPPSCTLGCTAAVTTARQPCRSPVRAAGTRRWRRRAGPAQSTYPRRHGLYHRCCGSASVRPPCGPPTAARSVCRQYSRVRLCLLRYPVAPIDPDRTEMAEAFRPISVAAYRRSLQTTEEGKQTVCLPHKPHPQPPTSRRARAVLRRSAPPLPLCCAVAVWCLRARAVNSPRRTAERFAPVGRTDAFGAA